MSLSFWITLVVSILAFIPVWRDHGKTWKSFKDGPVSEKRWCMLGLALLWGVPILVLVAAVAQGLESLATDRQIKTLEQQLQPRNITEEQRGKFRRLTKSAQKCPVTIHCGNVDNETKKYVLKLREMLDAAGYSGHGPNEGILFDLGNMVTSDGRGSQIVMMCVVTNFPNVPPIQSWESWIRKPTNPMVLPYYMNDMAPAYFTDVKTAFTEIGVGVLDGVWPLLEAYPTEIREQLRTNPYFKSPFEKVGIKAGPGEIVLIVNEKSF